VVLSGVNVFAFSIYLLLSSIVTERKIHASISHSVRMIKTVGDVHLVRARELELPVSGIELGEEWNIDRINHVTPCKKTIFKFGSAL